MTVLRSTSIELHRVSKWFGTVRAVEDVTVAARAGEVTCLLGDNGAGKTTLVKIMSGVHSPTMGDIWVAGERVVLSSPRDALARGIVTVFQDLAMIPLMSVWRNVVLGAESTRGWGPFRRLDLDRCRAETRAALAELGLEFRDVSQLVGTLSGGERQAVAIARAVARGARVLVLDEPTAALGVKQATTVLRLVGQAKKQGIAVVLVTHNPQHAAVVGDRFVVLVRGRVRGEYSAGELGFDELVRVMGGGVIAERTRRS